MISPRALPPNRSYDGTGNNPDHPRRGSVGEPFARVVSFAYSDDVSEPSGPDRPNARAISNKLCKQIGSISNRRRLSDLAGAWALLVSHELISFRAAEPAEPFGIPVPDDDEVFEPGSTIPVTRALYDISTGRSPRNPRRQVMNTTSYLDASAIYGIDATRAAALRTFAGGGMKTSDGNLLPLNTLGLPNRVPGSHFFLAGDERANTTFALGALHPLFVREHNRLANEIAGSQGGLSDEDIYQRARRIVGAQIQVITYGEFLPALLGPHAPSGSVAYDPAVDTGVSELFSVVGFRFGHSTLPPRFVLQYDNGEVRSGPQRNSFFNVEVIKRDGLDPIFRGLASQPAQEIDLRVIDDIRHQTIRFGVKIDLVAYDVQSAREFGIPNYVRARMDLGLPPIQDFADITSDPKLQRALQTVYGDVERIDPLIGGLSEDHVRDSSLGAFFTRILVEQFERSRRGDRFWFENDPAFSRDEREGLKHTRLADIIRRNTGISEVAENVFFAPETELGGVKLEARQESLANRELLSSVLID